MANSSSKNSFSIVPWLALLIILCIICVVLASAPQVLTFLMDNQPFGSSAKTQTPSVAGQPNLSARVTAQPSQPTQALEGSQKASGTYLDDFSDLSTGWIVANNPVYNVGYSKQQDYFLKIMAPDKYIFLTPPQDLSLPYKNAVIKVEIKQENFPESSYGVMCNFLDSSRYYAVEIRQREYKIIKMNMGQETALTSPEWKKASNVEFVDIRGYAHLTVTCTGSAISVDFNGQTQPVIVDPANTFQSGNVAVFARSGSTAQSGLYEQVSFDNFSLTVKP
jgi:hypothetical protein